jgi:hypothetical protein
MQHKGKATLVLHSCVFGRSETEVVEIATKVERYAEHPQAVYIRFREPRKHTWAGTWIEPVSIRYAEILVNGRVVYDTRSEIPFDMAVFRAGEARTRARHGLPDGQPSPNI